MVQSKCKSHDLSPGHYPWTAESCLCATCIRECKGMRLPTYPPMASEKTQCSWRDERNTDRTIREGCAQGSGFLECWNRHGAGDWTGLPWVESVMAEKAEDTDWWRRSLKCACLSLARLRTAWRPFPPWLAHSHAYNKWTTNIWTMRLWNFQK